MNAKRISARYLATNADQLSQEELLELLLRYCEEEPESQAQALLSHYGNLANLLDSRVEDMQVYSKLSTDGIALVRLVTELHRRYLLIRSRTDHYLKDSTAIAQYMLPLFSGEQDEVVYLLCLNGARMVLGCTKIAQGVVDSAHLSFRTLVKEALQRNASAVVLAHNHPTGLPSPSEADIRTTLRLQELLSPMNISFLDHIIFSNDSYLSMRECGYYRW